MITKKYNFIIKINKKPSKGFTLVETLVAISILVIALTGPLAIIAQSLKSSYFSRDEITAAYLAQEPIEFIRNMRDQNTLRASNSTTWLKGEIPGKSDLTMDANQNSLFGLPDTPVKVKLLWHNGYYLEKCLISCLVSYDPTAGTGQGASVMYGNDANLLGDSIYTREIYLTKSPSDPSLDSVPQRELIITVVVSWKNAAISHNVTVTEHLFNWELENQ